MSLNESYRVGTNFLFCNTYFTGVLGYHRPECVQNHPSVWAEKGVWNWVLKDAVLFDKPIRDVKGKLSFWEYEL